MISSLIQTRTMSSNSLLRKELHKSIYKACLLLDGPLKRNLFLPCQL